MAVELLADRPTYRRSGRVRWGRLLPLVLLPPAIACGMAVVLCKLLYAGWYYSIVVPAVMALPVAAAAYLTVRWAHCRNTTVAAGIGLLAGLLLFPGYYQLDMAASVGPNVLHRVDLLPHFIVLRMNTDAEIVDGQRRPVDVVSNWCFFVVDLLVVVTIVVAAAVSRSYRAYCEECGRWMRLGLQTAPPGAARRVATALADGTLDQLPEAASYGAKATQASAHVTLQICRNVQDGKDCSIYLTLRENNPQANANVTLLERGEISLEELKLLAMKLPSLAPLAPPPSARAAAAPAAGATVAEPEVVRARLAVVATVEDLPSHTADSVYTKQNMALAVALSLFPVAALLVGVGLIGLAVWLRPWAAAQPMTVTVAVAAAAAGLMIGGFGLIVCWFNVDYFNHFISYLFTKYELQARPGVLVNPDSPHAVYVEVVPRKRWADLISDYAEDGGFLMVDEANREVLFEGVKQRYRIPGAAITHCEAECTQPEAGSWAFYATVVGTHRAAADHSAEPWEASFMVRPVSFHRYNGAWRKRSCEHLRDRIRTVM